MKLWSPAWTNGDRIPARYAAGRLEGESAVFSDNLSPPLQWADLPPQTGSLALLCLDFDVPADRTDVNRPDRELPGDLDRADFFHWVLVDLPPQLAGLAEGEFGRGFTPGGKPGPQAPHGARQGLNDFTGWFADDAQRRGRYFGYDGPFPPFNDSLVHHYVFTLYALSVPRLPLEGVFTGAQVREAIGPWVLNAATYSGTYSLNRRLAP